MFWKKDINYVIIVLGLIFMSNQFRHKTSSGKRKRDDWKGKVWGSNIFSVLLIIILVISFVKVGKEIRLRYEIKKEINTLQVQLEDLEDKTAKVDKLISYLKTDEYIEKQARIELNLSKPGERQVNLSNIGKVDNKNLANNQEPNIEKWFNYFFH